MQFVTMAAIYCGTALAIWAGIHFGGKWIDRMLSAPERDPNQPIWKPTPCAHGYSDWRMCSTCNSD